MNRGDCPAETGPVSAKYLTPTAMIDSDHPAVETFAWKTVPPSISDPADRAVRLYDAVRDQIRYDPYVPFYLPEHYQASGTLARGRSFCVGKAVLLCALGRALKIPARLGFATVRNHLATRQLIETLGSDRFVYHGYTEFWLHGRWVKATPAFNAELCRRHGVAPLPFDGRRDAVFQASSSDGRRFMEYLADHGHAADVPLAAIVAAWRAEYGPERVDGWVAMFEAGGDMRNFDAETVLPG